MTSGLMTQTAPADDPGDPAPTPVVPEITRRRLTPRGSGGTRSWVATGVIVFVAGALRLIGITHPPGKIFDEIYYATEGRSLFQHGVEWDNNGPKYVVHPPLGKWIIGLGEQLWGNNELGWRFSAAIAGTLAVLIVIRVAQRLFGSTVLAATAGLLMTLDGMEFVLSRAALLDIFLMLFVLAAFASVLLDRDQQRRRWLAALERGVDPERGFVWLGVPWWRLAAGVLIGCACGVKWSGIWYVFALILLIFLWEGGTRRTVGVRHPWLQALAVTAVSGTVYLVLAFVTYLAAWTGWFVTDTGWDRHWLAKHGRAEPPVIGALVNLWHYHVEAYDFHTHLTEKHTYQSWPWQWLLLGRPVAFYYKGDVACGAPQCSSEVLLLGTPILWWSFLPALVGLAWAGIARRDWRAGAIAIAVLAGIVPWFQYEVDNRTMFYFYALPAEPFLILAVVYVLGVIVGPVPVPGGVLPERRLVGVVVFALFLAAVALCFVYFYPIYTGQIMTYDQWWSRMWLGTRWV